MYFGSFLFLFYHMIGRKYAINHLNLFFSPHLLTRTQGHGISLYSKPLCKEL